jgi:hypothetical protein
MGDVAYRQDAVHRKRFLDYIIKHHRSWLDFATVSGHDVSLSDLMLVTGCDKTSEWACAAWSEKTKSLRANFFAGSPGVVQGNVNLWGRWQSEESLDKNVGPQRLVPTVATVDIAPQFSSQLSDPMSIHDSAPLQSTSPLPANQCVFVRGYQMGNRTTWLRRTKTCVDVGNGLMIVRKPLDLKKKKENNASGSMTLQNTLPSSSGRRSSQGEELSDSDDETTSSLVDIDKVRSFA